MRHKNMLEKHEAVFRKNPELGEYISRLSEKNSKLLDKNKHLEEEKKFWKEQSITDGLTTLGNRRYFDNELTIGFEGSKRYGHPVSLIIGDIDWFKTYNDRYGHLKGDKLLQQFGYLFKANLRPTDKAFRYGGEEIALILLETTMDDAVTIAERFRGYVEQLHSGLEGLPVERVKKYLEQLNREFEGFSIEGPITMSFGVATYPGNNIISPDAWLESADKALYYAKEMGRNRVCTYDDVPR